MWLSRRLFALLIFAREFAGPNDDEKDKDRAVHDPSIDQFDSLLARHLRKATELLTIRYDTVQLPGSLAKYGRLIPFYTVPHWDLCPCLFLRPFDSLKQGFPATA